MFMVQRLRVAGEWGEPYQPGARPLSERRPPRAAPPSHRSDKCLDEEGF
jgi:hypothetical protein